jgi:hypothetical protein
MSRNSEEKKAQKDLPEKLYYDGDDSSDEEDAGRIEQIDLAQDCKEEWENFKESRPSEWDIPNKFFNDLKSKNLTEKNIQDSFLLHIAGIKALYEKPVDDIYRQNKKQQFGKIEFSADLTAAVNESVIEMIKSICEICYRDNSEDENALQTLINQVLNNSQNAVEEFVKILAQKRFIGSRTDKVVIDKDIIKKFGEKITEQFFAINQTQLISQIAVEEWLYRGELDETLGARAIAIAKKELQGLEIENKKKSYQLLEADGRCPDASIRKKNIDFSKQKDCKYPQLLQASWNFIQSIQRTGVVQFDARTLTKAYLADLVQLDSNNDSDYWLEALKYDDVLRVLQLDSNRVKLKMNYDFEKKFPGLLAKNIKKINIERPILPESHKLISGNIDEFLANIRLANKSQTRAIKNLEAQRDQNIESQGEIFYRSWQLSKSEKSKPALERQEITSNSVRSDFVDNAGSYSDVALQINRLILRHKIINDKIDDKIMAQWILAIIQGVAVEELQAESAPVNFTNEDKKILVNVAYLMFGTETARNPASLIANLMIIDLIEEGGLSWQNALSDDNYDSHYKGGASPMTIGKMPKVKAESSPTNAPTPILKAPLFSTPAAKAESSPTNAPTPILSASLLSTPAAKAEHKRQPSPTSVNSQKTSNDLGEAVKSARKLHQEYAQSMPYPYKYEGDVQTTITKTAELVKREADIVRKWTEKFQPKMPQKSFLEMIEQRKQEKWRGGKAD